MHCQFFWKFTFKFEQNTKIMLKIIYDFFKEREKPQALIA